MTANVGFFLHDWARRDPARTAVIDGGDEENAVSYGELDRRAAGVAEWLRTHGIGAEERVAICTGNGLGFVSAWFGAVYAGCATLPIPPSSTAREIAFRLDHAKCAALLSDAEHSGVVEQSLSRARARPVALRVEEAVATASKAASPEPLAPDALAMLLYTSGTTGAAKCACITHGSLIAHTRSLAEHTIQLSDRDRVLGTLPLTHSYGIRTTFLLPFFAGAATVFVPRFSPRRTLELCHAHRVTWLPGVPTMFIAWADEDTVPPPRSLRWCMSAGAPLSEEVRLRAESRLGAPVRQAYGLTEANLTTINAPPDRAVPGSSGRPVAGVEIRIAAQSGAELPRGTRGEVLVRGKNVMAGYLDDRLATAHALRGGWLHTGDIGFVDEAGRLTIVDRSKDLILRGGASIYPSEIERALASHPAVQEVAVIGEPDPYYGEEVVAVVVSRESVDAESLDAWVRERLAPYKTPRRYAFVAELPRGGSGKTLKRRLRDRLVAGELEAVDLRPHRPTD